MKWLKWLLGFGGDEKITVVESSEKKTCKCSPKNVVKGFVDPETGKVYKTAGSLKAAQTRRKNKAKKKTKK